MPTDLAKVKELFLALLEMPVAERAAYLDGACAGDAGLRQRLEAMLQSHENSGELLPRPAAQMLADGSATEASATATPAPGPAPSVTAAEQALGKADDLSFLAPSPKPGHLGRLGHYEVQEVIGKGGFGIVLKAFDERLHRVVAIKVLAPAYAANGPACKRFIREARAAAAVKNEHVVGIHDVQKDAQPPYLVMEYIEGLALEDKIDKRGPLSIKEVLRIGMQIAEGLAAAHRQGLVHRDIKPANILLENGVERVKITDFGLARAVDDASVTQSGTVAGTPMYMSPEQAEGLAIDHRSDLFSLGTVLYAMCTGHPPFRASGTHAVLKRVIDASPRPIREINPEVPDWLCDIIAKLHAKKAEERFQTALEVAELLGQHLAHVQQPNVAPQPARIAVPVAGGTAGTLEKLLEASDISKRLLQHVGSLIVLALGCTGVLLAVLNPEQRVPGLACMMAGVVLGIGVGRIKQSWSVTYRGHQIRFTNSCLSGKSLFIDGELFALGGVGLRTELRAAIPGGEGAGEEIVVFAESGLLRFRCRILVDHFPAPARSVRLAVVSKRQRILMALAALGVTLMLIALGLIFGSSQRDRATGRLVVELREPGLRLEIFATGKPETKRALPPNDKVGIRFSELLPLDNWNVVAYRGPLDAPYHARFDLTSQGRTVIVPGFDGPVVQPKPAGPPDEPGWAQLFNGKDLTGWIIPKGPGKVDWLVAAKNGYLECSGEGIGVIFTERADFTDFHLKAEVSSNQADCGIFFRVGSAPAQGTPSGYETFLGRTKTHKLGGLLLAVPDEDNAARLVKLPNRPGRVFLPKIGPAPFTLLPLEISARGNHFVVKIDGEVVDDCWDDMGTYKKGRIALQFGPGATVSFKKIEIKELPPDPD